jgi:YVTN family beta-propeller protein
MLTSKVRCLRWLMMFALAAVSMAPRWTWSAQATPVYRIARTVELGAPDRWDYVVFDAGSGRVFVAHGDEVTVVDGEDGRVVGHITGLSGGSHGIAIAASTGRGYTDDGKAGQAVSFDLKTLEVKKRIRAAPDADGMSFDTASGHVFVVNGDSGTLTVIDPVADAGIAQVAVGGGLEYAVPDGRGTLYVNGAERQELIRVDTNTNAVTARWPIPQCLKPHGLAIDAATQRLFVSCVNNVLVVVDAARGGVIATLPIGSGTDSAAFDPERRLIFSSNGRDGTLSIIREVDAQTFVDLGSITTALTARTMGINPRTGRLYLAAAQVAQPSTAASFTASGARPVVVPGSLKLLFLDPEP